MGTHGASDVFAVVVYEKMEVEKYSPFLCLYHLSTPFNICVNFLGEHNHYLNGRLIVIIRNYKF
jgi:hypothetical protein